MSDDLSRRAVLRNIDTGVIDRVPGTADGVDRYNVGIYHNASGTDVDGFAAMADDVDRRLDFGHLGVVLSGRFPDQARQQLRANPLVKYVERDDTVTKLSETLPWGIDRIDADLLHADGRTGGGATVAVLDTGVDDDHPDLPTPVRGKCFSDSCCGEASCDNGNTCNETWSDDDDHGTHVAGTIGALDNTEGVIGVGTEIDIMAGKVLDGCGSGSFSSVADGVKWATDNGADVINMSLGADSGSQTIKEACQYAHDNDVVVVAAAGNPGNCSSCDCSSGCSDCDVGFPAAYSTVIAVSATRPDDTLAHYSAVGSEVELAAPGGNLCDGDSGTSVLSTVPGGYAYFDGTSMASPHVAGAAAMVKAETSLSGNDAIRDRLNATAEDIGLSSEKQGNGLVDATAAVLLDGEWTFEVGARMQHSSVVANSSRVFVGSLDSTLYALDRSDGTVQWTYDRAGSLADSSPALAGGRVYVGSGGGTLYAFDATIESASVDWTFSTDSAIVSSPTVANDIVYVGTNDGRIVALDDTTSGAQLWGKDVGESVFSTPVVDSGTVYVTTGGGTVVALDTVTGDEMWRTDLGSAVGHGSPAVGDGRVYVAADAVYALDPADGSERWQASYGGTAGSSPVYDPDSGQVVVGSADGAVYALDASDGTENWSHATGDRVGSTPTVASGRVVVGSDDGHLYLLDVTDGSELSRRSTGQVRSRPVVDNDEVVAGTWAGTVVTLSNVTG